MAKSSYQKGNAYELEVVKILKAAKWAVFRQHRKPMYIQGKMIMVGCDIFGCDIVAKMKGQKPLWIQVSTLANKSNKIKQVEAFPWDYGYERVEIWCRRSGSRVYDRFAGPFWREKEPQAVPKENKNG